ncbi:phosphoribosylamine--glycine ligase [Tepidimicrobium xylanilyticum]|uniref:Phosphoribosylamine--glycine ligase n=1 Tax=Tepidimicrobium xylanilyticum TaxID=1123352 RepID=A0A1H2Q3J0_9FIRM|nr:phosphoribosylamine--glycine ligase [Tepidimicrobium xylanilyticum]SDW01660.1 phosphoribosylamine--glycine ligase [Tepidimicrobium xylanilyticum]
MKVLVLGSGGREHALCWKLAESKKVSKVYCAPGNGGTKEIAQNIDIEPEDIEKLMEFVLKERIDLTIVGPENPLVMGIVDRFKEKGLRIFGANKKSAQLEGSKSYAKEFMEKYNIPTAKYKRFTDSQEAINELDSFNYPLVIKADGLCLGKGVVICNSREEAIVCISDFMEDRVFGASGETIIIEEFLEGVEASLLCFVSKGKLIPMESAKDYKQIYEGDTGPNTGGVGCFSPNPLFTEELERDVEEKILNRIELGLEEEKLDYDGILFIGLMITESGPKVLEFNVRFGDPETEVLMPRLESDLVDIIEKTLDGDLKKEDLIWKSEKCVTVVATSKGYPGKYEKGKGITGLKDVDKNIVVFHNGTIEKDGMIYTNGGRVISVTALGNTLEEARDIIYKNLGIIKFDGMYYRRDIAKIEYLPIK